jgi:hypothetical protein
MKAVMRLVMTYALGTRVLGVFGIAGIAIIMLSFVLVPIVPPSNAMLFLVFAGVTAFFLGSALMPVIFGQMARGRAIRVLPLGRLKLLASVFIIVTSSGRT